MSSLTEVRRSQGEGMFIREVTATGSCTLNISDYVVEHQESEKGRDIHWKWQAND